MSSARNPSLSKLKNQVVSTELAFILFLFSGVYKTADMLSWIPVDPIIIFAAITIISSLIVLRQQDYILDLNSAYVCFVFVLFSTYAAVTGLWSPSVDYFASKTLRLLGVTSIAIVVPALVITSSRQRVIRAGFFTVVLSLITAFEAIRLEFTTSLSPPLPFNSVYILSGRLVGFGMVILLFYLLVAEQRPARIVIVSLCVGILFLSLMLLGARGPLIATIISSSFMIFILYYNKAIRKVRLVYLLFISIVLGGLAMIGIGSRAINRLQLLAEGGGSSLEGRLSLYQWTVQNLEFPSILFGYGLGSFGPLRFSNDAQLYPHNILLEILFETGLIGVILFIVLLLVASKGVLRKIEGHQEQLIIPALFIYMLLNAFVSGDINGNRFLFAMVGFMTYRFNQKNTQALSS
jgi:O-antigen ligase